MSIGPRFAALLGSLLLAAFAAHAMPKRELAACRTDPKSAACAAEYRTYLVELYGLQTLEHHRDSGDQVRRAFYVDGYGHDLIAISFVRPKGKDPILRIDRPRRPGEPPVEPLEAPVAEEAWQTLLSRSELFDRSLVPLPQPRADGSVILCLHGWGYMIEALDPRRSADEPPVLRRKSGNACDDDLLEAYATEVYRAAVPLIAPCALLDRRHYRNGASILAACFMLKGDRLAAAAVLNRADPFRWVEDSEDSGLLKPLFDSDAVVDWSGQRNTGSGSAAQFWAEKADEYDHFAFYFESIIGDGSDHVRVIAFVERWQVANSPQPTIRESAKVEQVWKWDDGGDFVIESVKVGPFERVPES